MKSMLVGLGNPGNQYAKTRHNVGFECINTISQIHNFPDFRESKEALISVGNVSDFDIALVKPYTYMNNSGRPLPAIIKKFNPSRIIVIHDDIDLELGRVKFKFAGGNAGHNGLKSIDSFIGKNYWRIRVGIGRPENPNISVADFVLGRFNKEEQLIISKTIYEIANGITEYLATANSQTED